jgi:hypothetical protein
MSNSNTIEQLTSAFPSLSREFEKVVKLGARAKDAQEKADTAAAGLIQKLTALNASVNGEQAKPQRRKVQRKPSKAFVVDVVRRAKPKKPKLKVGATVAILDLFRKSKGKTLHARDVSKQSRTPLATTHATLSVLARKGTLARVGKGEYKAA